MAFKLQPSEIDLGQTPIENIFINDFMPLANGTFVKVYLLGYHYAQSNQAKFSNESLAKHLNLSIEDVLNAWDYWEKKGLISRESVDVHHSKHQYHVIFNSIREVYIKNNYTSMHQVTESKDQPTSSDRLFSALSNPMIRDMLSRIQYTVRRALTPKENTQILDWMTNYKMDPDLIERAFTITFDEREVKTHHFNYVENILVKWYDKRLLTLQALENYMAENDHRHLVYKQVYKALGISGRMVSVGDKELIDTWCDDKNYDLDYLLFVIKEATKRTNNPNLNYMAKIFTNIAETGPSTIEGATEYFEKGKKDLDKTPPQVKKKTKHQNFKQSTYADMTKEEMQAILKRKAAQRKQGSDE